MEEGENARRAAQGRTADGFQTRRCLFFFKKPVLEGTEKPQPQPIGAEAARQPAGGRGVGVRGEVCVCVVRRAPVRRNGRCAEDGRWMSPFSPWGGGRGRSHISRSVCAELTKFSQLCSELKAMMRSTREERLVRCGRERLICHPALPPSPPVLRWYARGGAGRSGRSAAGSAARALHRRRYGAVRPLGAPPAVPASRSAPPQGRRGLRQVAGTTQGCDGEDAGRWGRWCGDRSQVGRGKPGRQEYSLF